MPSAHRAAILSSPEQLLTVDDVETYQPGPNEVLIRNHAIAVQPHDAKMLISNYGPAASLKFPATLGSSGAGVIKEAGSNVTHLQVDDRVLFDTRAYVDSAGNKQQGTRQQLFVSSVDTVSKIDTTPFEQAVLTSSALQTAVAALHVFLGIGKPGTGSKKEKVLICGAGSAVGQNAVQYAASVGHTVIATASPHSMSSLLALGASVVLDYRSPNILADLRAHGLFSYLMTCSGDASFQHAIIDLLSLTGGRFASVLLLSVEIELPSNVEIVYTAFSQAAQKEVDKAWRDWWYKKYLPSVLASSTTSPINFTKVAGGLSAL